MAHATNHAKGKVSILDQDYYSSVAEYTPENVLDMTIAKLELVHEIFLARKRLDIEYISERLEDIIWELVSNVRFIRAKLEEDKTIHGQYDETKDILPCIEPKQDTEISSRMKVIVADVIKVHNRFANDCIPNSYRTSDPKDLIDMHNHYTRFYNETSEAFSSLCKRLEKCDRLRTELKAKCNMQDASC